MKYFTGILFIFFLTSTMASTPLQVPSIDLKTIDGKTVNIKERVGKQKLTMICFWATWSSPSTRLLNDINENLTLWNERYDVELVAVNYDMKRGLPRLPKYIASKKWEFSILLDQDKRLNSEFDREFSHDGVLYPKCGTLTPYLYLVDQQGKVLFGHNSYSIDIELIIEDQLKLHSGILKIGQEEKSTTISESITKNNSMNKYPEITYPAIEGSKLPIKDLFKQKELSLVLFWGTNGFSARQIRDYQKLYSDWKEKYDVQIIVISVNSTLEKAGDSIRPTMYRFKDKMDLKVLLDEWVRNGKESTLKYSQSVSNHNGVPVTPFTILVSKDGTIFKSLPGYRNSKSINQIVDDFFNPSDK